MAYPLSLFVIGLAAGCSARPPDKFERIQELPRASKIVYPNPDATELGYGYIEFYNHPFGFPDYRSEKLAVDECQKILKVFSEFAELEATSDERSRADTELGSIRIIDNNGDSIRICWFFNGRQEPLLVSIKGRRAIAKERRFEGEETLVLDSRLRDLLEVIAGIEHLN